MQFFEVFLNFISVYSLELLQNMNMQLIQHMHFKRLYLSSFSAVLQSLFLSIN